MIDEKALEDPTDEETPQPEFVGPDTEAVSLAILSVNLALTVRFHRGGRRPPGSQAHHQRVHRGPRNKLQDAQGEARNCRLPARTVRSAGALSG